MTLTKQELREIDIRYEIDELKKERRLTDFEDEVEAIDEKIDKLEIELLSMTDDETTDPYHEKAEKVHKEYVSEEIERMNELQDRVDKAREEYRTQTLDSTDFIDMSGATDNGDR